MFTVNSDDPPEPALSRFFDLVPMPCASDLSPIHTKPRRLS